MMKKSLLFCFLTLLTFSCKTKKDAIPAIVAGSTNVCTSTTKADAENITLFPASHPINTDISAAAGMGLDSRSANIITLLAGSSPPHIKADFGSGIYDGAPIGIPYIVVCNSQPSVPITFRANDYDDDYGDESDAGPYPIPLNAAIEGNGQDGDSHVLCVNKDNGKLYELYNASKGNGQWQASSGAVFDLNTVTYRTAGYTSADAAGLPIFPLLVRYEEILKGTIDHAIRFTLPKSLVSASYTLPARHLVNGSNNNASTPVPMGIRLRLKNSFDISTYSATNKIILQAMKTYGIMLADIGSSFYITGAPDDRWDNDDLQHLGNVKATDFEVVQMGTIVQ
jgi:hypothetical protein